MNTIGSPVPCDSYASTAGNLEFETTAGHAELRELLLVVVALQQLVVLLRLRHVGLAAAVLIQLAHRESSFEDPRLGRLAAQRLLVVLERLYLETLRPRIVAGLLEGCGVTMRRRRWLVCGCGAHREHEDQSAVHAAN